jgi:hypothetical protein
VNYRASQSTMRWLVPAKIKALQKGLAVRPQSKSRRVAGVGGAALQVLGAGGAISGNRAHSMASRLRSALFSRQ